MPSSSTSSVLELVGQTFSLIALAHLLGVDLAELELADDELELELEGR